MDRGLSELLRYNAWANAKLLDACGALSPHQLQSPVPPTSESVAELLAHIAGAEENWVHWVRGAAFESALGRDSAWPGLDEVASRVEDASAQLIEVAAALDTDGDVDLWHHGATHRYPIRFLLANVIEHGIRHRTEVARMFVSLGEPAPDLDGWAYGRFVGYGRVRA